MFFNAWLLNVAQLVYNQWRYGDCDYTVRLPLAPGGVPATRRRRWGTQRGEEEGQGSCYRKYGQPIFCHSDSPVWLSFLLLLPKHQTVVNFLCNLPLLQFLCEVKQRAIEELQIQEQSTGKLCGVIHAFFFSSATTLKPPLT